MTDNRDGLLGRLFGRSPDADAETDPETEIQPSLPDAGGGVDEFHEVVEHAVGAGVSKFLLGSRPEGHFSFANFSLSLCNSLLALAISFGS